MLNKYRLILILLLYAGCVIVAYPHYKYLFCFDEIGYVSVTKKLGAGEYFNAINGYWSPLLSWLALPFYKAGLDVIFSIRLVSMLAGAGILITVNRLLQRFRISDALKTATLLVCIPILLCYVFCEQAADVLFCFFLLLYACIFTGNNLFENRRKIIVCGITGCLCYLTKAYAFPFFLAHFTILQVVLYYRSASANRKKWLVRNLVTGIGVFLLLASPWIYAVSHKYQMPTFGYSGKLNYYYHIYEFQPNSEKFEAVDPSPDLCSWEDPLYLPWYYQPHPPLSPALIKKQLSVSYTNVRKSIFFINDMSFLGMAIFLAIALYAIKKKHPVLTDLLSLMVILPAGYLLVAIEFRYLYAISFILLIGGAFLLSELWRMAPVHKAVQIAAWCIFLFSFINEPLLRFKVSPGKDPWLFQLADKLKRNGEKAKITSNSFTMLGEGVETAYLSNNKYYMFTGEPKNYDELLAACRKTGIDYYFYFWIYPGEAEGFKSSVLYRSAIREIKPTNGNVIVVQLK